MSSQPMSYVQLEILKSNRLNIKRKYVYRNRVLKKLTLTDKKFTIFY